MLSLSAYFLILTLWLALKLPPRATLGHYGIAPLSPYLFHMLPHDLVDLIGFFRARLVNVTFAT